MKMNKFLVCAMLVLVGIACGAKKTEKNINVVFIGNSITHGATLSDRDTQAPPIICGKLLGEKTGCEVIVRNCGVSGCTTLDFLSVSNRQWPNVIKNADELHTMKGTLVFSIMLGTNDSAMDGCFGSPVVPEQYYTNMKVIIDALLDRYKEAVVVVQYPLWYSPSTYNGSRYLLNGLKRLQSYYPMIDKLVEAYTAEKQQRVFAGNRQVFDAFKDKLELFTTETGNAGLFYLHPNEKGAAYLADFWAESIKKILF